MTFPNGGYMNVQTYGSNQNYYTTTGSASVNIIEGSPMGEAAIFNYTEATLYVHINDPFVGSYDAELSLPDYFYIITSGGPVRTITFSWHT
jgi:hypothetical protein